ncbi:GTP-binding protein [Microbacterium sp. HD4P20]|uniref:GTP-binding protein n=1 Tax=Microbacterium sp. HD4P20 TaxID=2864874 RepID=UPI0020A5D6B6|nr:GTP-binding protein [Microbacterium sp. HD4P20]MCP2635368.1 GTP-binding protein [Microbacterium sp. HD4P20]
MSALPPPSAAGLAVTLVSGGDLIDSRRVAESMSRGPARRVSCALDVSGADSAEFAVDLAEALMADASDGLTGNAVVLLEPSADPVEVALVMEHVLNIQEPAVLVGIRDVVAVTSVSEVLTVLFDARADGAAAAGSRDFDAPGRLARRLEFASVIVLTDDDASHQPAQAKLVTAFLAQLAPAARVVSESQVSSLRSPSVLLVRGRAHRLGASMGWQQQLVEGAPAAASPGAIGAHVFRDPRPFHPGRLYEAIGDRLIPQRVGRILRSRGFVRLATRPDRVGAWSTAGDVLDLDPTSLLSWDADSPVGQEIVFFGLRLDRDVLDATLTACLLDPTELVAGPESWARYADPFPQWSVPHHH